MCGMIGSYGTYAMLRVTFSTQYSVDSSMHCIFQQAVHGRAGAGFMEPARGYTPASDKPCLLKSKMRVRCFSSGDQGVHVQTPLLLFEVADRLFRDQVRA